MRKTEFPMYRCQKQVTAALVVGVDGNALTVTYFKNNPNGGINRAEVLMMEPAWMKVHQPHVGGFLIAEHSPALTCDIFGFLSYETFVHDYAPYDIGGTRERLDKYLEDNRDVPVLVLLAEKRADSVMISFTNINMNPELIPITLRMAADNINA